jgi:hypothetical protein
MALHDAHYAEPLFAPILLKLEAVGEMPEDALVAFVAGKHPEYGNVEINEAIMQLETQGVIRRHALNGTTFIELIE